jgi:hypothetical protein
MLGDDDRLSRQLVLPAHLLGHSPVLNRIVDRDDDEHAGEEQ